MTQALARPAPAEELVAAAKRCHAVAMAKPLAGADVVREARRMLDAATDRKSVV
mgnify:CR=1 FL=1